ncbi:MAG: SDR family NAD(P)-dependent oxidoreductase [Pseudobdellovibrionaceae bacterium]
MKNTKNFLALVTGATSGIGYATACALAQKGHPVFAIGRRDDRLQALKTQLQSLNPQAEHFTAPVDMSKENEILQFVESHKEKWSQLKILINNAGLARSTESFHNVDWQDISEMMDVNVKGLLKITHLLLPCLIENSKAESHSNPTGKMQVVDPAHIVNLGSVAGRWTYPGGTAYCASKFAVRAISEGLRLDLLGKNIRVTNIEPGMVNTEFSEVRFRDKQKADSLYAGMTPLSAEDIAQSIVWCLDRPAHVNIQEMVIYPTQQAAVGQVHRV